VNAGLQQTFSKSPFLKLISGPYHFRKHAEQFLDEIKKITVEADEEDSRSSSVSQRRGERESESESTGGDSGSSSESESGADVESSNTDDEMAMDGERYAISTEETLELTKFLVGLCTPANFGNDAAAANFGKNIFSSLHKDLGDLCRLNRIPDIEPDDDIERKGARIYGFPNDMSTSHKMLIYAWGVRRNHASMRSAKKFIRVEFKRRAQKLKDEFRGA